MTTHKTIAGGVVTAGAHGATGKKLRYGRITLTRAGIKPGTRFRVKETKWGFVLTAVRAARVKVKRKRKAA